jgi:hypothetical protein
MRFTTALLTAFIGLPAPALADDASAAKGLAVVVMYDTNCAKLPASVIASAKKVLHTIPRVTALGAAVEVREEYASSGAAKWCERAKALIDNASNR